ncbi:MAG: hypothetical protein ABS938_15810 [Psychrobacillus psychrodurans]
MEINQESIDKLQELAKACTKILNAIFECMNQFIKWAQEKWELVKATWFDEYHQMVEKKENLYKHQRHMNFTRNKITHQVIDRRPKQMIRKIIH